MGGMQTKGGHSISQNGVENALNRTHKREKDILKLNNQRFTLCFVIFIYK